MTFISHVLAEWINYKHNNKHHQQHFKKLHGEAGCCLDKNSA